MKKDNVFEEIVKISKEEFVPANQILSGFKYMNPTSFAD